MVFDIPIINSNIFGSKLELAILNKTRKFVLRNFTYLVINSIEKYEIKKSNNINTAIINHKKIHFRAQFNRFYSFRVIHGNYYLTNIIKLLYQ